MPPDTPGYTPLQDMVGVITPSELHFMNTHYNLPDIDPATHRLMIHGMVDRPVVLTVATVGGLRATTSLEPPGANVTTRRTDFAGQS